MEDVHINSRVCTANSAQQMRIFAVCDGHGGPSCAKFLRQHLARHISSLLCGRDPAQPQQVKLALKTAFVNCEKAYERQRAIGDNSGSTCCLLVYFEVEHLFYVASCGDARAIVFDDFQRQAATTGHQVTRDHKPETATERRRIEALGGTVVKLEFEDFVIHRVNGLLAVARAFGDVYLRPFITELPDVFGPYAVSAQKNNAVVLACDGAFESNTTTELCAEIARVVEQTRKAELTTLGGAKTQTNNADTRRVLAVADGICKFAFERGTEDNVTAICLQFL
jgi:serine/threonine protein phosphatase PrpC